MSDCPPPRTSEYRSGKEAVVLSSKRGSALDLCASLDPKYLCCSVHVLRAVSNCPFECSYCFLQNYLTNTASLVVDDPEALLREVRDKVHSEPWRFFRIGTWELGDSLALSAGWELTRKLVEGFLNFDNAVLELKTKSDRIRPLLDLNHGGRTVVSWSLNTERIIREEEQGTASLDQRILSAKRVVEAGYLTGFHFDPMILYEDCECEYEELIDQVLDAVPADRIAWISMGSLRFNPEMRRTLRNNYPLSRLMLTEMVVGDDRKCRYLRPLRVALYKKVAERILKKTDGECFLYLCMERPNVWKRVVGFVPRSIGHLDYLMADSLNGRFPGLVRQMSDVSLYEKADRSKKNLVRDPLGERAKDNL